MKPNKIGLILLITVLLLSLIAMISVFFISITEQHRLLTKNFFLQVKANHLAYSGLNFIFEKYQSEYLFFDKSNIQISIGPGTLIHDGDISILKAHDANGRINVNDGISAGEIEELETGIYNQDRIDPTKTSDFDFDTSGKINLRLRRILNSYGDVHRFIDHIYDDDYKNVASDNYYGLLITLPNPVFSITPRQSSDTRRKLPMAIYNGDEEDLELNLGLGDQIILHRPPGGYKNFEIIKDVVNTWAEHDRIGPLSQAYLNEDSFFNLIKDDLTLSSFEDEHFHRLKDETSLAQYHEENEADDVPGDFIPRDLQTSPPSFFPTTLFSPKHPVPLINLNQASFFVRAAVFYAPVNVSYHVDGATTVPPYFINPDRPEGEFFTRNTGIEAMIASPSIGVMGPVFDTRHPQQNKATIEHGQYNKGRKTHLMSLRDAINLAYRYEQYSVDIPIHNFDDFYDFLVDHESSGIVNGISAYEKVLTSNNYSFDEPHSQEFNAGGVYGISEFSDRAMFTQNYIAKTLPHLLSCVRRIPGYYGAPAALQSPLLVLKPDYLDNSRYGYRHGNLCRQGFIKVEDFVYRAYHPKVCFQPCGDVAATSTGVVIDNANEIKAQLTINASVNFFDTAYFRTQEQFYDSSDNWRPGITDVSLTHEDINFSIPNLGAPLSPYLGAIGLQDYDTDSMTTDDLFMHHQGSYHPHIVMNFKYDAETFKYGLENESSETIKPNYTSPNTDDWATAQTNDAYPTFYESSSVDDATIPSFTNLNTSEQWDRGAGDISPFNGIRLTAIDHGEFSEFSDALYFRLDEWLNASSGPIGQRLSKGIMTFWFRVPSDYDYPTVVRPAGVDLFSESFTRILVHLNLWERYEPREDESAFRAVSLTIGLKNTRQRGLNVFMRYDSGGEHHDGSLTHMYRGANGYDTIFDLPLATFEPTTPYDFLGFYCDADQIAYTEPASLNYRAYRWIAHRSSEVSVGLKNQPECGPGTWHRVSAFWNLGFDQSQLSLKSNNQIGIELHDNSNKTDDTHEFHQGVSYASPSYNAFDFDNAHFDYPQDHDPISLGGNVGMIMPFNSSIILSLGDAHARRLDDYSLPNRYGYHTESKKGNFYPFWRLNSCIDNFRFHMGPSDDPNMPEDYFDPGFVASTHSTNKYGALRYKVINSKSDIFDETVEPTWAVDPSVIIPDISAGTRILSVGTRVYYPPDSNRNTSYIYLSCSNQHSGSRDNLTWNAQTPNIISKNEQNMFYDYFFADTNFRIFLQYKAFKPILDGNLSNMEQEPIIYFDTDHFTQIPWIKELSIRYTDQSKPDILKLSVSDDL